MIRLLVTLAVRSLWAHKVKSLFVGGILFWGTFLVVTGFALLNSVETAMERSITESLAGHLQVYDAEAKDPLEIFGGLGLGAVDIGEIDDFAEVETALGAIEGVEHVVPMGILSTTVFGRTTLDEVLEDLRAAAAEGDRARLASLRARVDPLVAAMARDHETANQIRRESDKIAQERRDLSTATSPTFWSDREVLDAADFLDTRIAPMAAETDGYFLRVVGTDLAQFPEAFPSYYVVQGEPIPPGKRGFLFSNRTYEGVIKNPVARELDAIHEAVVEDGRVIAEDPDLQEAIRINAKQYTRIVYALSPADSEPVRALLAEHLSLPDAPIEELVQAFLTVDDQTLRDRYALFYAEVAPRIGLYDPAIGEDITLRAFTQSGYVRAINVRVYGTYDFKGLEKSDIWTASNLTDLVTFRQLYGKMSSRELAELDAIKAAVGAASLSRDDAEDALFGGGGDDTIEVEQAEATAFDTAIVAQRSNLDETWSQVDLRKGLALNAAIVLEDPRRIAEVREAVEQTIAEEGLRLQVVHWQTAAGTIGQYVSVMRIVLWVALFIIFLVALIIINNAMVTATLDRTGEIGTMRAIGAQRPLVVALFVTETVVLGVLAGTAGTLAGAATIVWLGRVGIPAAGEAIVLLFAGPRLYPTIGLAEMGLGLLTILGVAVISSLYPSIIAARIRPVIAMQGRE